MEKILQKLCLIIVVGFTKTVFTDKATGFLSDTLNDNVENDKTDANEWWLTDDYNGVEINSKNNDDGNTKNKMYDYDYLEKSKQLKNDMDGYNNDGEEQDDVDVVENNLNGVNNGSLEYENSANNEENDKHEDQQYIYNDYGDSQHENDQKSQDNSKYTIDDDNNSVNDIDGDQQSNEENRETSAMNNDDSNENKSSNENKTSSNEENSDSGSDDMDDIDLNSSNEDDSDDMDDSNSSDKTDSDINSLIQDAESLGKLVFNNGCEIQNLSLVCSVTSVLFHLAIFTVI